MINVMVIIKFGLIKENCLWKIIILTVKNYNYCL
jgi:hypothetical protein